MALNVYEGMLILDSNRYGRDPDGVSGQVPALIQKLGGEVLVSRLWDERRLAYPIDGHRKGAYWLIYCKLDSLKLAELRRSCDINDTILRQMFLKVEPRIVDALVEHAKSAPVLAPAPAPAVDRRVDIDEEDESDE